jgi:hypothetical protein
MVSINDALDSSPMRVKVNQCQTIPFFQSRNLLASQSLGSAAVTLLSNGELDTLTLGQGDPGLLGTNDEDVGLAGGKGVVNSILDVDDVETTIVSLTVGDDTNTAHVATTGDGGNGTSIELDVVSDLAGGEIDLDGVVDLDQRVGVSDAAFRYHVSRVPGRGKHTAIVSKPDFHAGGSTKA